VLTLIVLDLVSDEEQDDDGSGDVGDALKRNNELFQSRFS